MLSVWTSLKFCRLVKRYTSLLGVNSILLTEFLKDLYAALQKQTVKRYGSRTRNPKLLRYSIEFAHVQQLAFPSLLSWTACAELSERFGIGLGLGWGYIWVWVRYDIKLRRHRMRKTLI